MTAAFIQSNGEMFRTATTFAGELSKVDKERGIIYGAKIISLGRVNDSRPWHVDEQTLLDVERMINGPNKGLKARWTHPNMCDDGLGKYLGRWQNARISGDSVIADLHLAKSAFDSPVGDLGSYVLQLAAEDAESFGVSVASMLADEMDDIPDDGETMPLRFAGLHAADLVDSPAATRGGLFSSIDDDLPNMATWLLKNHFSDASPADVFHRFVSFLSRFYERDVMDEIRDDLQIVNDVETPANEQPTVDQADGENVAVFSLETLRDDAKPFVEAFGDVGARWFIEGRDLLECFREKNDELGRHCKDLENQIAELQAQIVATDLSSGEPEPLSTDERGDIDPAQAAKFARVDELKSKGVDPRVAKFGVALNN